MSALTRRVTLTLTGVLLSGAVLTGCSTQSDRVDGPASQAPSTGVSVSATPSPSASLEASVNLGSTVAVLLPAPLSGPVNAQLSTALTRVATTSGHGWYAVLQVQPGGAQDVLDTLADGLVDAGYQVELSDGHISATLLAADAPVTMPLPDAALPSEPAAVPSPSESATPTPTASASQDPGAGDLPGLALTPAVPAFPGGVKTTPGEPVPLVGTWVEVHLMGVQAGPDTPRPDREFITVSFVERLT